MTDRPRFLSRLALIALTATLSFGAVGGAMAQAAAPPVNPIGTRPIGPGVNDPTFRPRLNTPNNVLDIPLTTIQPYGPVVIENLDQYRQQLISGRQPVDQAERGRRRQFVARSGFEAPTGDHVPDEVLLTIAPTVSVLTLNAVARLHKLTRTESQDFSLTGRRIFRWKITDGRPVGIVINTLKTDMRVLAAQPNYLFYTMQQDKPAEGKPIEQKPSRSKARAGAGAADRLRAVCRRQAAASGGACDVEGRRTS